MIFGFLSEFATNLGSWPSVNIHNNPHADLPAPCDRLEKERVLSLNVGLPRANVEGPVSDGNADCRAVASASASRCAGSPDISFVPWFNPAAAIC